MKRLACLILSLAMLGCSQHEAVPQPEAKKVEAPPPPEPAEAAEGIELTEAMMANIRVQPAVERQIPVVLAATGKVSFNEDRMAHIVPPVSGQVQGLSVNVGDAVAQGRVLMTINSREITAAITDYLENQKDADLAAKQYAMAKDLFDHQAGSRMAMQQAESDLAKTRARVSRSLEFLRILGVKTNGKEELDSHVEIASPLAGTVIERKVTEGQFVQPENASLITIADMSTVWVLADIYERDMHSVRTGQRAQVTTEAYPDQGFSATVSRIGDVLDPQSRTVKVRFLVNNPQSRLKPEMFANVRLFLNEAEQALCIPTPSVFIESGQRYVYVQQEGRRFERREVETTPAVDGVERVSRGLKPGDKVVAAGALLLRQMEARK